MTQTRMRANIQTHFPIRTHARKGFALQQGCAVPADPAVSAYQTRRSIDMHRKRAHMLMVWQGSAGTTGFTTALGGQLGLQNSALSASGLLLGQGANLDLTAHIGAAGIAGL